MIRHRANVYQSPHASKSPAPGSAFERRTGRGRRDQGGTSEVGRPPGPESPSPSRWQPTISPTGSARPSGTRSVKIDPFRQDDRLRMKTGGDRPRPGWEAHDRLRSIGPPARPRRARPRLVRGGLPRRPDPGPGLAWPSSARARTCSWSRRRGRARRSPRSWRSSTGSFASTRRARSAPGLRCVYVSPLRSLGYDIERNLAVPLEAIRRRLGLAEVPVAVGVRTGDTSAYQRRKLRDEPPHLLITTPESLSLLLSQPAWHDALATGRAPDRRRGPRPGADEARGRPRRLARTARRAGPGATRPGVGLSATCRPAGPVARFLVGPAATAGSSRPRRPTGSPPIGLEVESLLKAGRGAAPGVDLPPTAPTARAEATGQTGRRSSSPTPGPSPRRSPTTSGRAAGSGPEAIAAHHSALDADRRRAVEAALKAGDAAGGRHQHQPGTGRRHRHGRPVGPGRPARGRLAVPPAGRAVGARGRASRPRGLILAADPRRAGRRGRHGRGGAGGPGRAARRSVEAPLDVLCQQLIGMACGGEWSADEAFALIRRAAPMAELDPGRLRRLPRLPGRRPGRAPGALRARAGRGPAMDLAPDLEDGAGCSASATAGSIRWFWGERRHDHLGGVGAGRWSTATRSARSKGRTPSGSSRATASCSTAGRWSSAGSRGLTVHAKASGGEPSLPRWSSDRQGLSAELARDLAAVPRPAAAPASPTAPRAPGAGSARRTTSTPTAAGRARSPVRGPGAVSEIPAPGTRAGRGIAGCRGGWTYAFHAPLSRAGLRGPGPRDRRPARPTVRPRPDLGRRRPRLVDPAARRGGARARRICPRLLDPEGLADDVSKGSTAATCWPVGSGTSRRRP